MFQEGNNETLEQDRVELLQSILEKEQGRPVPYEEASEIADAMIRFYETLAHGLTADDLAGVSR